MGLINLYRINDLYKHIRQAIDTPHILRESRWWNELAIKAWRVQEVREAWNMLSGYKSYIVAALGVIVAGLHATGQISDTLFQTLMALLGSGAVATVRAAIRNIGVQK